MSSFSSRIRQCLCSPVRGLFSPEDNFSLRLRKITMVFALCTGLLSLFAAVPMAVASLAEEVTWAAIFRLADALFLSTGVVHFTYARWYKTVTDRQLIATLGCAALSVTLHAFSSPMGFGYFHSLLISTLVWPTELHPRIPVVLWAVFINVTQLWTKSIIESQDAELHAWMLVVPDAKVKSGFATQLVYWIISWGCSAAFFLLLIHYQSRAFQLNIRGLTYTNAVVDQMLEKIKTFDIEGAREQLQAAELVRDEETNKPLLTEQFGSTLEGVCDQLESYRPYLPNWLLLQYQEAQQQQQTDSPSNPLQRNGEMEEEPSQRDESSQTPLPLSDITGKTLAAHRPHASLDSRELGASMCFDDEALSEISSIDDDEQPIRGEGGGGSIDFAADVAPSKPPAQPMKVPPLLAKEHNFEEHSFMIPTMVSGDDSSSSLPTAAVGSSTVPQSRRGRSASSRSRSQGVASPIKMLNRSMMMPSKKTISICSIDFEPRRGKLRREQSYLQMVQALMDAVAMSAKDTLGSIHGTTGDQVVVSWNASMNAAQPGLKACQFMCQVKEQLEQNHKEVLADINFSAAAKTGSAWCHHVVSSTGAKTSSFMIHYLWRAALEALSKHARAYKTLLVDEQTFELGQLQCEGWLVDALRDHKEPLPNQELGSIFRSILDDQTAASVVHGPNQTETSPGGLSEIPSAQLPTLCGQHIISNSCQRNMPLGHQPPDESDYSLSSFRNPLPSQPPSGGMGMGGCVPRPPLLSSLSILSIDSTQMSKESSSVTDDGDHCHDDEYHVEDGGGLLPIFRPLTKAGVIGPTTPSDYKSHESLSDNTLKPPQPFTQQHHHSRRTTRGGTGGGKAMLASVSSSRVDGEPGNIKGTVVLCYELLRLKSIATDEWLYSMQEESPCSAVTLLASNAFDRRFRVSHSGSGRAGTTGSSTTDASLSALGADVQAKLEAETIPRTLMVSRLHQVIRNLSTPDVIGLTVPTSPMTLGDSYNPSGTQITF